MCLLVETHTCGKGKLQNHTTDYECFSKLAVSMCSHARASNFQNTHLIQDSSSSISRKNWCKRWDSFSFARRAAAILLILWKRPLIVSRLSFTWDVSKALLVIKLSAWLFRSFRRSWKYGWKGVSITLSHFYTNKTTEIWLLCRAPVFKKTCSNKYMTAACIEVVSAQFADYEELCSKTKSESNTSWEQIYQLPVAGASSEGC